MSDDMPYCASCEHWEPTDTLNTHGTCDRLGTQKTDSTIGLGDFTRRELKPYVSYDFSCILHSALQDDETDERRSQRAD